MILRRLISIIKVPRRSINLKCPASSCVRLQIGSKSFHSSVINLKLTATDGRKIKKNVILQDRYDFANTFGNLQNEEITYENVKDDPEDIEIYKKHKFARQLLVINYIKEIREHLSKYEYNKAVKIVEIDMVNDSKPLVCFAYRLLLSYLGKVGDLKEAYRLYTDYKKRNGIVTDEMYTSLLNACANCKNSSYALEKADAIREYLYSKGNPNISHYNCMLKVYGSHGDLLTCFNIFDNVQKHKNIIRIQSYNFLLNACISDKNSGLRHALIIWRKMIKNNMKPSAVTFNLMLQCIRDCSFGDVDLINDLIKELEKESGVHFKTKVIFTKNKNDRMQIANEEIHVSNEEAPEASIDGSCNDNLEITQQLSGNKSDTQLDCTKEENIKVLEVSSYLGPFENNGKSRTDLNVELPNLLEFTPSVGTVISFGSMTKPQERFLCFGGVNGFLKTMSEFGVEPNVKILALILDVIPGTKEAEEAVIQVARDRSIKLDTQFLNILMRKRISRNSTADIEDCLRQFQALELSPCIVTFGILSMTCKTRESGLQLIKSARNCGIRLNCTILTSLLHLAHKANDFEYINDVIQAAKEDEAILDAKFIALMSKILKTESYS